MKKRFILQLLTLVLFVSCSSSKGAFKNERVFSYQNLNLNYALELEARINSEDISSDYRIGLGKGIYPNENNYKLEISKNFKRILKPNFSSEVDYHFTKDSIIRVIMFQWNDLKSEKNKKRKNSLKSKKIFQKKFWELSEKLSAKLGQPIFKEIQSDTISINKTYRDGIKWRSNQGVNAYLFAFGNLKGTYNQIRLAIYRN